MLLRLVIVVVVIAAASWFYERGSMEQVSSTPAPETTSSASPVPSPAAADTPAPTPAEAVSQMKVRPLRREAPQIRPAVPAQEAVVELKLDPKLEKQFVDLKSEVLKSIPTQKQLAALTDEQVHMTPTVIVNASIEIGKMAQLISDHPELSNEGLPFYRDCAENAAYPNSMRASCYLNFTDLSQKSGIATRAPNVPEQIKQLAQLAK